MRKQFKSLAKNSVVYGLGNVISKAVGFILMIIYSDHLVPEEFGIFGLFESAFNISVAVFSFGIEYALLRWYWDEKFKDKKKALVFTCLVFLFVCSILTIVIFWNTTTFISVKYFNTDAYSILIKKLLIVIALFILGKLPMMLLRILEKPKQFIITNTIKAIFQVVLTVYFLAFAKRGLEGIYDAQILACFIYLVVTSVIMLRNIEFKIEYKALWEMIVFQSPFVLSAISLQLLTTADRFVLKHLGELDNVGIYTFGSKIGNALKTLVVMSIWLGINPMIMKMMNDKNNKEFYSKIFSYGTVFVLSIVLPLALFSKEITMVISRNPEYHSAYSILPILFLAIVFDFMTKVSTTGILIVKKPAISATAIVVSSIINIGLNFALIPFFSNIGAAIATLISQIILFLIIYINAQKQYAIPYKTKKLWLLLGFSSILCAIPYLLHTSMMFRILVNIAILIVYILLLLKLNYVKKSDIEELKKLLSKVRR